MRIQSEHFPTFALLLLPIVIAALGTPLWMVAIIVPMILLWRWGLTLKDLLTGIDAPDLVLDTMSISHFAEKARWCLDLLDVAYVERADVGIMGVLFTGRTVPRLSFRAGLGVSQIGNSAEILRYLWGRYAALTPKAAFLEPTLESLELEEQFDAYGAELQRWVYSIVLPHQAMCRRVWGLKDPATPLWQRALLPVLTPINSLMLKKAFRIHDGSRQSSSKRIEATLQSVELRLADGRPYLLGKEMSFVDVTFAALSGLWLGPDGFSGGRADSFRPKPEEFPKTLISERDEWRKKYPKSTELIERMYLQHRGTAKGG